MSLPGYDWFPSRVGTKFICTLDLQVVVGSPGSDSRELFVLPSFALINVAIHENDKYR